MPSTKKTVRLYKNHVDSIRKAIDCKKTCKKNLVILELSVIISKKVKHYQDLNNDLQHISNRDLKQKLNLSNKVLTTKEASEHDQRICPNIPDLF